MNFNHSVFVTSPFFLGRDGITLKGKRVELDGQTALNEYDEDKKVLKELSKEIQDVIEESLHKHMAAQVDMRMNVTTFKRLWSSITGCSENSITW